MRGISAGQGASGNMGEPTNRAAPAGNRGLITRERESRMTYAEAYPPPGSGGAN